MLRLIVKRLLLGLVTVALVSVLIFVAVEALPGDACTAFLERDAHGQLLANCRKERGLDQSATARYVDWVSGAISGEFGRTGNGEQAVASVIGARARNSFLLAGVATLLGIPLAIFLGVVTALARDRVADVAISSLAILAMTVPEFVTATMLLLVFSAWLGWLPGVVLVSANAPLSTLLPQIVLPVITVTLVLTAHILRMVRSSVIEVMTSDYVQMARLKGVPYWQIVFRHVLPNALPPAINIVALTIAWLLGGLVVIEIVFNYPGLGRLMIEAITQREFAIVQAVALILAAVYVTVNLLADVLTLLTNPRLRTMQGGRR